MSGSLEANPEFRNLRVLIVDDEDFMVTMLRTTLRRLGAPQPTAVSDGLKALALVQENPEDFDLIISDLNMPTMNGLEFLRQLRDGGSKIPFIMLTGNHTADAVKNAASSGVSAYIAKPFSGVQLAQKISGVMRRRSGG
jgi:CheY-like chemotaxis protein